MPLIPARTGERIVIVGDSLSADPYTTLEGSIAWPSVYASLIGSGVYVESVAISGRQYSAWTTAEIETLVVPLDPTLVIVELGANDLTGSTPDPVLSSFGYPGGVAVGQARAQAVIDRVAALCPTARIVVATIIPIGFSGVTEGIRLDLNTWKRTADSGGIPNADACLDLARVDPDDTGLWPEGLNIGGGDFIHPNQLGLNLLAQITAEDLDVRYAVPLQDRARVRVSAEAE